MPDAETLAGLKGQIAGATHTVRLINATTDFMSAPTDSLEESMLEEALLSTIEDIANMSPVVIGNVLMTFTTLLGAVADDDSVQAWFAHHADHIREQLES